MVEDLKEMDHMVKLIWKASVAMVVAVVIPQTSCF